MSIESLEKELTTFLEDKDSGVFAVKGQWGVGKTYLVREVAERVLGKRKYAYVSLFGINSLDGLKQKIFIEIDDEKWGGSLKLLKKNVGKVATIADGLPQTPAIFSNINNVGLEIWMSQILSDSTICIDDIERRGKDLPMRDLLGFLHQLKEEKKCKIVLIFNEDELGKYVDTENQEDNDGKELDKYREKVIDREIEFVPRVESVIEIGFKLQNPKAIEVLRKLKVNNIRAVSKIGEFISQLERVIKSFDTNVQDRIAHSAVILGWFYFTRNTKTIPWAFIKRLAEHKEQMSKRHMEERYNSMAAQWGNKEKPISAKSPDDLKNEKYITELREYNYKGPGPLEDILIRALEQGFYDAESLGSILSELASQLYKDNAIQKLGTAWELYRNSYDDNTNSFVSMLVSCFEEFSKHYSLRSLVETIGILNDLGRNDDTQKILDFYFFDSRQFDEGELYREGEGLPDDIKAKVMKLIGKTKESEDFFEILQKAISGTGAGYSKILHTKTVDDWKSFIKEEVKTNSSLDFYIKRLLDEFGELGGIQKEIAKNVAKALRSIGSEGTATQNTSKDC